MKKKTLFIIFSIIVVILLMFFGVYKINSSSIKFDSKKWQSIENTKRYKMVDSLQKNYNLIGMNKNEIIELLGNPEYDNKNDQYEYIIKDDWVSGRKVLIFYFDNDIVIEVEESSENW